MKKVLLSLTVILLLLYTVTFPALGETAEDAILTGTWRVFHPEEKLEGYRLSLQELGYTEAEADELIQELVDARMYYIFGEDGTLRSLMEDEENPVDVLYTYETEDNLLIIHYSLDGAGEEIITVYEFALEGDVLSLTDETGDETWLKREAE